MKTRKNNATNLEDILLVAGIALTLTTFAYIPTLANYMDQSVKNHKPKIHQSKTSKTLRFQYTYFKWGYDNNADGILDHQSPNRYTKINSNHPSWDKEMQSVYLKKFKTLNLQNNKK